MSDPKPPSLFTRVANTYRRYPRQFWLMFAGMLLSTVGASMIWPFLMLYVSKKVDLPLTYLGGMLTLNAAAGLVMSFLAGPVVDRVGRKGVMIISLAANGLTYYWLGRAETAPAFAVLITLMGAFSPLYRIGSDAMLADLIPAERRIDAYALLRLSNNLGISIGPAVGGMVAAASYSMAFSIAMLGFFAYSAIILFLARETLPVKHDAAPSFTETFSGYAKVAADAPFVRFLATFTFVQICAALIWVLMPVYAQEHFGVPENQYGFIPATNALMVVGLQILFTRQSKNHPPLLVMALGALFYGLACGGVAFGQGFWGFLAVMVVMTIGELLLVPTASTYVANLAPADMRGRYMSASGLTWGIASGVGPVFGGFLNDTLHRSAPWFFGLLAGIVSASGFAFLWLRQSQKKEE